MWIEHSNSDVSNFQNEKILITGASGFIGRQLSKKLIEKGAVVHGTSRELKGNDIEIPGLYWHQGTFDNPETSKKILKKVRPDYIFHLAGDITAANSLNHVGSTYGSLLTSTLNLLTEAAHQGCKRIVLTGSSTEPEKLDTAPSSPYAAAKTGTVIYGKMFQELYELPVVIVRPFMGFGPGQPHSKILPYVILSLLKGETPKLTSGSWEVDWIYIDDLIDGVLKATVHPEIIKNIIDLGSGKLTSVRQMVENIAEIMETDIQPQFGAIPDRFSENSRIADVETTYKLIGWRAKTSIENGLKGMIQWFYKTVEVINNVKYSWIISFGCFAL